MRTCTMKCTLLALWYTHFSLYQRQFLTLKYAKNTFVAGALPQTQLGEITALPHTPSRPRRGIPPPRPPPRSPLGAWIFALLYSSEIIETPRRRRCVTGV